MAKKKRKPPKPARAVAFPDAVQEAQDAFDAASQAYIAAVNSGDPAAISSARRALLIAIANYIAVVGTEPE